MAATRGHVAPVGVCHRVDRIDLQSGLVSRQQHFVGLDHALQTFSGGQWYDTDDRKHLIDLLPADKNDRTALDKIVGRFSRSTDVLGLALFGSRLGPEFRPELSPDSNPISDYFYMIMRAFNRYTHSDRTFEFHM